MTRIATPLILATFSAFFGSSSAASDGSLESLQSRIATIEARLGSLEKSAQAESGSHSYRSQALLEATNGGGGGAAPRTAPSGEESGRTYVIQTGDTLGSIARAHGVERSALLEANRLGEGQPIYIGETLFIPGKPGSGGAGETSKPELVKEKSLVVGQGGGGSSQVHTVVKGDTLTSLARRYNTTVPALKSANGLGSDVISLGQKLTIPSAGAAAPASASASASDIPAPPAPAAAGGQQPSYEYDNPLLRSDETYGYYTVRKGDNLYALARDFFTTMPELQRLNRLGESTVIYPGNELIVPTGEYNRRHNQGGMAQR